MDSNGSIPPFSPDSSHQPEDSKNQKKKQTNPQSRRYTPESSGTSRQDLTPLPEYGVTSVSPSLSEASTRLPDRCPSWFKTHEELLEQLAQYQHYFSNPQNHMAFLKGDGPCYNPLIITRLSLTSIIQSESFTNEQKRIIEEWQDAALKHCPIPWRTLPLKLNHLNREWTPSPEVEHFIKYDEGNRSAQQNMGFFIPDWMKQEVLGVPVNAVTISYWNLRNKYFNPGKHFLTIDRLKSKDKVLYNWLALFKDPRVREESGLSDLQITTIEHELSLADQSVAKLLKKRKCKTKSHHYTWKDIVAEPGLYEEIQQQLNATNRYEAHKNTAKKPDTPEPIGSKRGISHSATSPDNSGNSSISPPATKKKRALQYSQPVMEDASVNKPPSSSSSFLMVDGKKYPYSEQIKYAGKPDVHRRLKTYDEPHVYDFETVSESQIPKHHPPSSALLSGAENNTSTKVVFHEMDIPDDLFPILEMKNTDSTQKVAVKEVIERLELISSRLYLSQKIEEAEKLFDDLLPLQKALQTHFDKVYQQHTDEMYTDVHEKYKHAGQNHGVTPEFEALLSKEQHYTFETILAAQDELSQFKFQTEYCLKRLRQNLGPRNEIWHTAELLTRPMTKTRACLLGETGVFHQAHSETKEWIPVPAQYLAKLKHHGAINHDSESAEVKFTPAELWHVVVQNLQLFKKQYSNNMGVWDIGSARKECDEVLVIFDYLIEYLKSKRAEDTTTFNNYMTMEKLRTETLNFRDALKNIDHSEKQKIMSDHLKKALTMISLQSSQ